MPYEKINGMKKNEKKLIFPCSGAADVGELSDRVARQLTKQDYGNMFCLAGIGGNVSGLIKTAKEAKKILIIDGCNLECAKKTLDEKSIKNYSHLIITKLGFEKSKSPLTKENLSKISLPAIELLKD